ncbi:MAG TPA: hypothetical protein VKK79_15825 [Candidatus Lokiarchaeia archaeon]|nr:hypothetical protein [Candidatus Lokiarchaeia archaeon]
MEAKIIAGEQMRAIYAIHADEIAPLLTEEELEIMTGEVVETQQWEIFHRHQKKILPLLTAEERAKMDNINEVMRHIKLSPRNVVGPLIKDNLLARLKEGKEIKTGRLEVRQDGVIFITSPRFGNELIQVPQEDISEVVINNKGPFAAGTVTLHIKDGNNVILVLSNADKWGSLIAQQLD